jgi:hypothetical protein
MVRKVGRAALLVAALTSITFAINAVYAGGAHAQTAPICLTVPASTMVTCFDEFGNPVGQFPNPAASVPIIAGATVPATVITPSLAVVPGTMACFTDQFGNVVCAPAVSTIPLAQPVTLTPVEPQSVQSEFVLPQSAATTGLSCFVNLDGSVSCV